MIVGEALSGFCDVGKWSEVCNDVERASDELIGNKVECVWTGEDPRRPIGS